MSVYDENKIELSVWGQEVKSDYCQFERIKIVSWILLGFDEISHPQDQ